LNFGLGQASSVERVEVRWPSGKGQEWRNVGANRRVRLTEGEATAK
jgi:hypothetical protein